MLKPKFNKQNYITFKKMCVVHLMYMLVKELLIID
jgi:hypothetical protein